MVMKKNVMAKNLGQTILKSITRYIAIVLIIALGTAFFVGLKSTKKDMVQTGQEFMDEQNMFDLRLLNTYGWSQDDVAQIAQIDGVVDAEGVITFDTMIYWGDSDKEYVYKIYAIPESVNQPMLLGGRMPETANECLVDGAYAGEEILGQSFTLSAKNDEDTLDSFAVQTFTIVGYVSTPLFMDMSRGSTSLGNGTVTGYFYVPREAFDVDYYTEIDITIVGDYRIYTEEFDDAMDAMADYIKPLLEPIAQARYESVTQEAWEEYNDGIAEYEDGLQEFLSAKQEALQVLADSEAELRDAQAVLDENRALLEDGLIQIEEGQKTINENQQILLQSRQQLAAAKAEAYAQLADANSQLMSNYKTVTSNLSLVEAGITQIDDGLIQINDGISQLENGLDQLELMATLMDTMISVLDISIDAAQAALDQARESGSLDEETLAGLESRLAELVAQKESYDAQYQELLTNQQTYTAQLEELYVKRDEIVAQREELVATRKTLEDALAQINDGFLELENSQIMAQNEFAAAEAQIESGQFQLDLAQAELDAQKLTAEEGLAALDEAQQEIDAGWEAYRQGREEALLEFSEVELELLDAKVKLDDAKNTLDTLEAPSVYALTRNTNISYLSLDSNSDIMEGISAVFPVFFLLIAALVCITTMTRMVEEERTQIGTLKALGYSNFSIISKYLVYAGSAAFVGCVVGMFVGSAVFPMILWEAYNIILNIRPNITLLIDWQLGLGVLLIYTAVTLLVTWYCCRSLLRDVPAELIRPKPPTSGKKIFLEYLPFWNKISFLNKVMFRNIFRYRQRLLMMLVGVGGCTALLLTGFGIRDSIMDIVDYQFEDVTLYDMEVRFSEGQTLKDQDHFREEIGRYADRITFAHQSSVEAEFGDQARDVTLIAANSDFSTFMDFHYEDEPLSMPGTGEALLSVGAAEMLGVQVGDQILVRNTDMQILDLTVSGIYENYVYNYVIVTPETIAQQWGEEPELQMAYIIVKDTQDVYYANTKVSAYEGVMSVSVVDDLAEQVGSMLEALDLVVVTIVICAGLLAVTVSYNLTNINITERIREIATIKVLGFNDMESALYVFKENLLLSAMGSGVGLLFGRWLLEYVMSQIKVDMVWMPARLMPMSYVWAMIITMLMAVLVDFILYFKLDKINMAEALKSVE